MGLAGVVSQLARKNALRQFLRFGVVGGLGLIWDTSTVYLLRPLAGLTIAMLVAYFVAATLNWAINRLWTFRGIATQKHLMIQWLHFLGANSLGFVLNRSTAFLLVFLFPLCVRIPALPLAAGALAGLFANFNLSRRLVFGTRHDDRTSPEIRP